MSQFYSLWSPFPNVMSPLLLSSQLPLPAIMSCFSFLLPGTCLIGHSVCAGPLFPNPSRQQCHQFPSLSAGTKPFFIILVSCVTEYPCFKEKRVCLVYCCMLQQWQCEIKLPVSASSLYVIYQ